jgi:hypothetical protein
MIMLEGGINNVINRILMILLIILSLRLILPLFNKTSLIDYLLKTEFWYHLFYVAYFIIVAYLFQLIFYLLQLAFVLFVLVFDVWIYIIVFFLVCLIHLFEILLFRCFNIYSFSLGYLIIWIIGKFISQGFIFFSIILTLFDSIAYLFL